MNLKDHYCEKGEICPEDGNAVLEQSMKEARLGIIRPLSEVVSDIAKWEDIWNTQNM